MNRRQFSVYLRLFERKSRRKFDNRKWQKGIKKIIIIIYLHMSQIFSTFAGYFGKYGQMEKLTK